MTDANACRIRFVRPFQYADMLRSYQLRIDGRNVGKVARNDTLEITAPPGDHRIEASIDWGRSRPLVIRAAPGETVDVEVRNRWSALLALWAITFGKNSYLMLTELGRQPHTSARQGQT
jgi:hypothetical protein